MLWDVIDSYEYDGNPDIAMEQKAKVLEMALTVDRRGIAPEKLWDYFQKAKQNNCLSAAVKHVVKECEEHLSGLFRCLRTSHLSNNCAIVALPVKAGRDLPHVKRYNLDLRSFGETVE